jgi:hypothetical protein
MVVHTDQNQIIGAHGPTSPGARAFLTLVSCTLGACPWRCEVSARRSEAPQATAASSVGAATPRRGRMMSSMSP